MRSLAIPSLSHHCRSRDGSGSPASLANHARSCADRGRRRVSRSHGAILAALDEAEHSVREGGELRGLLRMSMPTSVAIGEVIPRLSTFTARDPHLQLQPL